MDREEAIYILKNAAWLGTDEDREKTEQAIDMAIEALKKDRLIEAIANEMSYEEITETEQYAKGYADGFKEALSADAVQGVGRYENAMQKLRDMPRYLNGVKEKQITKTSANYTTEKPNDEVEQGNDVVVEPTDLISREDAMGSVQDHFNDDGFKGYDDGQKMMDRIKALPSAETHEIRTETHGVCSDLISRADALKAIDYRRKTANIDGRIILDEVEDRIRELPSADIISKSAVMETIGYWTTTEEWGNCFIPSKLVDMINELPSADRPSGGADKAKRGSKNIRLSVFCMWTLSRRYIRLLPKLRGEDGK